MAHDEYDGQDGLGNGVDWAAYYPRAHSLHRRAYKVSLFRKMMHRTDHSGIGETHGLVGILTLTSLKPYLCVMNMRPQWTQY